MQTEFIMPRVVDGKAAGSVPARNGELADFSTDHCVLLLSAMRMDEEAIGRQRG